MKKRRHGANGTISTEVPISDFGDGEVFSPNGQPPLLPTQAATHADRLDTDNANAVDEQVSDLAFMYWQSRGCPEGSPEVDWFRAEKEVSLQAE